MRDYCEACGYTDSHDPNCPRQVPTEPAGTPFIYLLNNFEQASQSNWPSEQNYAERRAVLAYVDKIELALSQAKRDAERYRFLRSEAVCTEPRYYEFWNRFLESKLVREESMDKLIDDEMNAALAKREGEGEE